MDIKEQVARIMFDDEFTVPEDWTWESIKVNAPISSIKCERLADQILNLPVSEENRWLAGHEVCAGCQDFFAGDDRCEVDDLPIIEIDVCPKSTTAKTLKQLIEQ